MTAEEAIKALKHINLTRVHPFYSWEEMAEVRDTAIEALEKQIPKKPLNQSEEYDRTYGNCPCCGEMVVDYPDDFRVCSNCGQVIDWGEEE